MHGVGVVSRDGIKAFAELNRIFQCPTVIIHFVLCGRRRDERKEEGKEERKGRKGGGKKARGKGREVEGKGGRMEEGSGSKREERRG